MVAVLEFSLKSNNNNHNNEIIGGLANLNNPRKKSVSAIPEKKVTKKVTKKEKSSAKHINDNNEVLELDSESESELSNVVHIGSLPSMPGGTLW